MPSTKPYLVSGFANLEHMMQRSMTDMDPKSYLHETLPPGSASKTGKPVTKLLRDKILDLQTVGADEKDMNNAVVQSSYDHSEHMPDQWSKYVVKSSSETRSKIELVLADIILARNDKFNPVVNTS